MKIRFNPEYRYVDYKNSFLVTAFIISAVMMAAAIFFPDRWEYEYVGRITYHQLDYTYINPETQEVRHYDRYVEYVDHLGNEKTSYDDILLDYDRISQSKWKNAYHFHPLLSAWVWLIITVINFFAIGFFASSEDTEYVWKPILIEGISIKKFFGK